MKRQKIGLIFILMLALYSGILASITWNLQERSELVKEPSIIRDKHFYIDCLEKLINMPIASAGSSDLNYSTFIGGSSYDEGNSIVIDSEGCAYLSGWTGSSNFITTPGACDRNFNGARDVFVSKLSADGSTLIYSTFIGGSSFDYGRSMTVGADGCVYITGETSSTNFPTTTGAFDETYNGDSKDVFVSKLSADGSTLIYSTFIGGNDSDCGYSISVGADGSTYIAGTTYSSNFPTTLGAYDETHNGYSDVFICKLSADGSILNYSTYIGGSSSDRGNSIAIGADGSTYITGHASGGFPTTTGAFDETYNGNIDVFISKLSGDGSTLIYSTFIGGSKNDKGFSIAIDADGSAYVTGETWSSNFNTTTGAFDRTYNGGDIDAFACKLSADGSTLVYSTFIGGFIVDKGYSITIDTNGCAYITGETGSSEFNVTLGAFDRTYNGGRDVFVSKLSADGSNLFYSTYIGGTSGDCGNSIAIDSGGHTYITGYTFSSDFNITSGAFDEIYDDYYDIVVCKFNKFPGPSGPFSLTSPDAGTPDNDGQFNLNWGISEGADNYTVYWDTVPFTTYTGTQNILIDELNVNTAPFSTSQNGNYYFRVCARNVYGGSYSDAGCLELIVEFPKPGPFSLISPDAGTPDNDGQFTLNWGISEEADNYTVYWDTTSFTTYTGTQNILINELDVNTAPFSTSQNGNYYFRVCARNETGERYSGAACLQIIVEFPKPGPFSLTSPNAGSLDNDGHFNLNWDTSEGADNYTVYWDTIPFTTYTGTQNILIDELNVKTTTFSTSQEGTYYFRVCAKNGTGERYSDSGTIQVVVQFKSTTTDEGAGNLDNDLFLLTVLLGIFISISILIPTIIITKKRKQSISWKGQVKKGMKSNDNKSQYYRDDFISGDRLQAIEQQHQSYYPPTSPKISVYCASCNAPDSITRERFYHFTCNQCGNYFFNVGYFCRNCNKIYPISKEDFIKLQEAETLLCYECNNVMELSRSG